jgi:TPR repeat protein
MSHLVASAAGGHPLAQTNLAVARLYAPGADVAAALGLLRRAVAADEPHARAVFGVLRLFGQFVDADVEDALAHLRAAAARGNPLALSTLATALRRGERGIPRDFVAARAMAEAGAARGYPDALLTLGVMRLGGEGGAPSCEGALEALKGRPRTPSP